MLARFALILVRARLVQFQIALLDQRDHFADLAKWSLRVPGAVDPEANGLKVSAINLETTYRGPAY